MQVNKAGSPCSLTRKVLPILPNPSSKNVSSSTTQQESQSELPSLRNLNTNPKPCQNQDKLHKKSYVEDLTLIDKISPSDQLQNKRLLGPLDYHHRLNLTLTPEKSILQQQLLDLGTYTAKQTMVIGVTL